MRQELILFGLALQFLTRLPVPIGDAYTPERMARSVRYYPLVGAVIGSLCAGIFLLADAALPRLVAVILSVGFGLLLTGAFHEDGLADTFDGVGGGLDRESTLRIMRDSRLGTYGAAALFMALMLKVTALASLPAWSIVWLIIAAHAASRMSALLVIATSRYVRQEGTGKPVAQGMTSAGLMFASACSLLAAVPLGLTHPPSAWLACILGLFLGHMAARLFYERKLGGYTGDTLGAVQQFSEIGLYLGMAAWR